MLDCHVDAVVSGLTDMMFYCCVWFGRYGVVTVASVLPDMMLLLLRLEVLTVVSGSVAEVLMCIIVVSESLPNIIMSVLKLLLVLEGCQIY